MCEFCTQHGEGKKWYENMFNYSRELFLQVNSDGRLKEYLDTFGEHLREGEARAAKWRQRLPFFYRHLVYPWITSQQKKSHYGQIIPIEAVETILNGVGSVVRLPCICRKINTGVEKRVCYGVGMDMTHILKDVPDFSSFDRISPDEAKKEIRTLDKEGSTHSVWTFRTPFIGALCNCDQDCMAYRVQYRKDLAQVMWRGEYIGTVDVDRCKGCRDCSRRCLFEAVVYDAAQKKCRIDPRRCYGCGVCRAVCTEGAITMRDRRSIPTAADLW